MNERETDHEHDQLEQAADPLDALRHDLARARRRTWVVAAAASLLVVALLGATTLERSRRDERAATRTDVPTREEVGDGSAEEIVAALPPEPLDPADMELVASVSRFDSCDALLDRLHRVGAAHVGSAGPRAGINERRPPRARTCTRDGMSIRRSAMIPRFVHHSHGRARKVNCVHDIES